MRDNTKAIHIGSEPDFTKTGDVVMPIHFSSTFARKKVNEPTAGLEYSRSGNPTRLALEKNLAALEHARYAFTYSSGLAAVTNILFLLKAGDEILSVDDVYGGTRRLFTRTFEQFGVKTSFVPFSKGEELVNHISEKTKMIWIETPTNPLLKIIDIAGVADAAHKKNVLVVIDNTFATPIFQKPLDLGADIVTHSMSKYINGHSDVIGGTVMVSDDAVAEKLRFFQNAIGAVLSPFDSYQVLRGIKTLSLRMQQHEANAKKVVSFLQKHPKVKKIYYPGLPTHSGYTIAKKQMSGFGAMISFELDGDINTAIKFLESLHLIAIAESLGAVESLIEHPASMTHASVPKEEREKIGLSDTLIRLSVGLEDADDLISDLSEALVFQQYNNEAI